MYAKKKRRGPNLTLCGLPFSEWTSKSSNKNIFLACIISTSNSGLKGRRLNIYIYINKGKKKTNSFFFFVLFVALMFVSDPFMKRQSVLPSPTQIHWIILCTQSLMLILLCILVAMLYNR